MAAPGFEPPPPPTLGRSIPADTPHAVSVSLPTWRSNVGYEEGEEWVVSRMSTGYPRFFIHRSIQALAKALVGRFGNPDETCMLLHSRGAALRCADFLQSCSPAAPGPSSVRVLSFTAKAKPHEEQSSLPPVLCAVFYPASCFRVAKAFWQHTGEGVSSRRAEFCQQLWDSGELTEASQFSKTIKLSKGPRRYKRDDSVDESHHGMLPRPVANGHIDQGDQLRFLEERFARNLDFSSASKAKLACRRRIAGSLTVDAELSKALEASPDTHRQRNVQGFTDDNVYLYPGGMNAIYSAHRMLRIARGEKQSICFGFPYIDTLKLLEKFGPGALFYGNGVEEDLDDLERRLEAGERYLALFCEFPSNPLLRTPNLVRIKQLSQKYDFAIVVDETIGNYLNVNVLPYADILVSSLTKIFSGESNVMGGSAILNPQGQYYSLLKPTWEREYEDLIWPEDAIVLERNSRDYVGRIARINDNAEALCDVLTAHPRIKQVYYPKVNPTRANYEHHLCPSGGWGGLLSATFYSIGDAALFYDALDVEKGPSLGTNFTLASPFVILAHYTELEWAASYGVEDNLVRFSVGLENKDELLPKIHQALAAIPQ